VLFDTKAKRILPFGTLGVHKKKQFDGAVICFFAFDILYLNGKDLLETPYNQRIKLLKEVHHPMLQD